jgi:hypothetical protein
MRTQPAAHTRGHTQPARRAHHAHAKHAVLAAAALLHPHVSQAHPQQRGKGVAAGCVCAWCAWIRGQAVHVCGWRGLTARAAGRPCAGGPMCSCIHAYMHACRQTQAHACLAAARLPAGAPPASRGPLQQRMPQAAKVCRGWQLHEMCFACGFSDQSSGTQCAAAAWGGPKVPCQLCVLQGNEGCAGIKGHSMIMHALEKFWLGVPGSEQL